MNMDEGGFGGWGANKAQNRNQSGGLGGGDERGQRWSYLNTLGPDFVRCIQFTDVRSHSAHWLLSSQISHTSNRQREACQSHDIHFEFLMKHGWFLPFCSSLFPGVPQLVARGWSSSWALLSVVFLGMFSFTSSLRRGSALALQVSLLLWPLLNIYKNTIFIFVY